MTTIAKALNTLGTLRRNQHLSPAGLKEYQEEKLRLIVSYAYDNVKYYRSLFERTGITPDDIRGLDDLGKIPITTKKDIQNTPVGEIVTRGTDIDKCVVKSTSGSTGMPLKVYLNQEERDFQILLNLRILMENGMRLTDKLTYIINPHRFPESRHWFQYLGILRRDYLSVFDFPQQHLDRLLQLRPDVIYGYPSNLTLLASLVREKKVQGLAPKLIFSVAEALEPRAREVIRDAFGVEPCDILGTIEVGDIAWQCGNKKKEVSS